MLNSLYERGINIYMMRKNVLSLTVMLFCLILALPVYANPGSTSIISPDYTNSQSVSTITLIFFSVFLSVVVSGCVTYLLVFILEKRRIKLQLETETVAKIINIINDCQKEIVSQNHLVEYMIRDLYNAFNNINAIDATLPHTLGEQNRKTMDEFSKLGITLKNYKILLRKTDNDMIFINNAISSLGEVLDIITDKYIDTISSTLTGGSVYEFDELCSDNPIEVYMILLDNLSNELQQEYISKIL